MGLLDRAGARLTGKPEEADVLVVNTCSFIDTAKQESVNTILEMVHHKTEGRAKKVVVAGCLVERYRDEIKKNIPEVDAVVGTGELESILEAAGIAPAAPAAPSPFTILSGSAAVREGREAGAGTHKASETPHDDHAAMGFRPEGDARERQGRFSREEWQGAGHRCRSICMTSDAADFDHRKDIGVHQDCRGVRSSVQLLHHPQLRGKFRSRRLESVVAEAERLVASGVQEITLIGQDTTCYGEDLGLKDGLATLLDALAKIEGLRWLRFLYAYPNRMTKRAAGDDRAARQHLQVSRCAAAACVARCAEADEARRGS